MDTAIAGTPSTSPEVRSVSDAGAPLTIWSCDTARDGATRIEPIASVAMKLSIPTTTTMKALTAPTTAPIASARTIAPASGTPARAVSDDTTIADRPTIAPTERS